MVSASNTSRRNPLLLGMLLILAAMGGCGGPQPPLQNVLLITLDTTRADYIGCYGADVPTPNLDRLAAEGVRFARCMPCTPLTLPSHSSIMTGTYPFVHGVRRNILDRLADVNQTLAEVLRQNGRTTHGVIASAVLRHTFGIGQGFDNYVDLRPGRGKNTPDAERKANEVCDLAIPILHQVAAEPFFLWVHFYDPHYPYESDRHPDDSSPAAYADEVTFMDAQVGRLLDELKALGLDGNTLVIAVGDHGEGLGDHGESEHGYFVYDASMRVPLLTRCPGAVPAGKVVEDQVRTIDVMPTILDFLGVPPAETVQGSSLRPLMAGGQSHPSRLAYGETMITRQVFGLSTLRAVAFEGWKYIDSTRPELYNLPDDPNEVQNLFADQPERAAALRKKMRLLLAQAPAQGAPVAAPEGLTAEDVAALESLGYVAGSGDEDAAAAAAGELEEPTGPSPADHAEAIDLYVRAHRHSSMKRFAEAEPLLRQAVAALPNAPEPLQEMDRAFKQLGRPDEILDLCTSTLAENPDANQMRIFYARQLLRRRRLEEGIAQLQEVIYRDPNSIPANYELGNAYRALDQHDQGRRHYERVLEQDPQHVQSMHGLAKIALAQNRPADAVRYLEQALAIKPNNMSMKRDLRQAREMLGRIR